MHSRYGRYTVVYEVEKSGGMRRVLCRCDCGTERVVFLKNLKSGNSTSCGCRSSEVTSAKNLKHGHAKTPTWNVWVGMIQRCSSASGKNLAGYFGRGIRVCDRWKDFENFLADMGERPPGMQIDRIDNNGNYEPKNCRWSTPSANARNTRRNTVLTLNGVSLPVVAWAEKNGWPRHVISNRLKYGWPVERVLTEPIRRGKLTPTNPAVGMNTGIEGGAPTQGVMP